MTTAEHQHDPRTVSDALMAPFEGNEVGLLPRIICPPCSKSRTGVCDEHQKAKCNECGGYMTPRHIHISYVGHADVTARLLRVDPAWTWEPMAVDDTGRPAFDLDRDGNPVGLWIRLTVGGVTRLGYGSVPGNQNDAVKVLIGDALRNAALRFGVAWELWAKGDRSDPTRENATAGAGQASRNTGQNGRQNDTGQARNGKTPERSPADAARATLRAAAERNEWDLGRIAAVFEQQYGAALRETASAEDITAFTRALVGDPAHVLAGAS